MTDVDEMVTGTSDTDVGSALSEEDVVLDIVRGFERSFKEGFEQGFEEGVERGRLAGTDAVLRHRFPDASADQVRRTAERLVADQGTAAVVSASRVAHLDA